MSRLISETDQKIINNYTSMIQQSMKEAAGHPQSAEQSLADYRSMMLKINPYKFPNGFAGKPVASFEPRRQLRSGLTAAVSTPKGKGPFPIMIHAHGHGLRAGSSPEYTPWIKEMSSHGFVIIFPDYRWQPEHSYEDQMDDMNFAIKWAKENAAAIHGDVERMTLGGDSAGAGLAFDLLLRSLADPNGPRFKAFASVDGNIGGRAAADGSNLISGLKPETPLPPVFLVVGSADNTAKAALQAASKFMDIKKDYELAIFYGMPHDFEKFPLMDAMHEANDRLMTFLNRAVS
jgi:acetyl esterase/lipase